MDVVGKIIFLIIGGLLALSGCSRTSVKAYVKPGLIVGPTRVESIAMFPFDNTSGHPDASKKIGNLLLTELVRTKLFKIADIGEVENALRRMRIRTTAEMDLEKLHEIGERLKVEAVIVGSVDEYQLRQDRIGSTPVVAINARMLDVNTGEILWTISHARDGNDWETVFGFGKIISLNQLAQIVVSETLESLVEGAPINAYLKAAISASPVQISEGQDIKIVMTVTNPGQATADDVVPSGLTGAAKGMLSPPDPAILAIPGGKTQDFMWVYTSAPGEAGDAIFSGNVSGKDHESGKTVSSKSIGSNAVTIQTPVKLTATIAVSPTQISEGQDIKIVMTVTNTGQATANDITPSILANPVNGILSLAAPVNATIPGGKSQNFTWTYISASGDSENVVFSGNASGKDHNSKNTISSDLASSNVVRIQTPANLTATISTSSAQISEGQDITVVMTLSNTGKADADAVIPSSITITGTQTLRLSSSPPPVEITVPGGGNQYFTWIYTSSGGDAGSVMFSGNASGKDRNSGNGVFFASVDSNVVNIQSPANLTATITASPAQINAGQDVTVIMTVTNSGQATVDAIMPSALTFEGIQTLRLLSSPPAVEVNIPGGGSQDFTWVYASAEGDAGSVIFSGSASGKDHNSGNRASFVSVDSSPVEVQTPASLMANITVSPTQVSEGQNLTVVMTVTNSGRATVNDVMPSELIFTSSQTLKLSSGPAPVSAAIPGGGSQNFTWLYTSAWGGAGDMEVSGNASGKDRSSGKSVSFAPVNSNVVTIQTPANLTATIAASPAQVSEGQDITVVMTVANKGQATADAVIPSIMASSVNGILPSANPISASIPGGGSQDFTWIYSGGENDDGNVVFIGNASGKDHNSSDTVSFDDVDSNVVSIQTPANLTTRITASPAQVSEGQDIAVVMRITNSGQVAADAVMPSVLTLTGIQTLRLSSSPMPAKADISSGGSQDFTWIYTSAEGDAGSLTFSGSASGRDHNSRNDVSFASIDSNVVSIQTPADLTAIITAAPAQISEGQHVTVVMTVTNVGQAIAETFMPSMLASSENGILSLPIPVNATIPSGGRQDFTWTYISGEGDAGEVVFSANGSGKDHNSGKSVPFHSADSDAVSVQTPANLTATIVTSPAQVSEGQDITIVMAVTNTGQAAIDFVTPAALTGSVNGILSSPTPARAIIPGGKSRNFIWFYTSAVGDAGDVVFSGSVSGKDHNSGNNVYSGSASSKIMTIRVKDKIERD